MAEPAPADSASAVPPSQDVFSRLPILENWILPSVGSRYDLYVRLVSKSLAQAATGVFKEKKTSIGVLYENSSHLFDYTLRPLSKVEELAERQKLPVDRLIFHACKHNCRQLVVELTSLSGLAFKPSRRAFFPSRHPAYKDDLQCLMNAKNALCGAAAGGHTSLLRYLLETKEADRCMIRNPLELFDLLKKNARENLNEEKANNFKEWVDRYSTFCRAHVTADHGWHSFGRGYDELPASTDPNDLQNAQMAAEFAAHTGNVTYLDANHRRGVEADATVRAYDPTNILNIAAAAGHQNVLEWGRSTTPALPWNAGTIHAAVKGGHCDLVRWMRNPFFTSTQEPTPFSAPPRRRGVRVRRQFGSAHPQANRIPLLPCDWDSSVYRHAVMGREDAGVVQMLETIESLQYLHSPDGNDIHQATMSGNLEALKFFLRRIRTAATDRQTAYACDAGISGASQMFGLWWHYECLSAFERSLRARVECTVFLDRLNRRPCGEDEELGPVVSGGVWAFSNTTGCFSGIKLLSESGFFTDHEYLQSKKAQWLNPGNGYPHTLPTPTTAFQDPDEPLEPQAEAAEQDN
uniref:Uncharacterized protein n=1 Tax=Chromera velia CCMP2878 TaxID=1169474 RepID=A0A0G4HDG6_9ALVE|eukprot:Cvel_26485.t1-p1 / transcript=Cvel_26485.t1 / gene=Cvel_26485 / organism=Chromera_velia_CCMP2878 / gene_product=hypothetical protein / transcript_product=hypothetical protein / location=Cvel_scaffold3156:7524-10237(-) / protein_length=576 / sequence_SO=supercontig / SO=protein_coding / is_pseudo=false